MEMNSAAAVSQKREPLRAGCGDIPHAVPTWTFDDKIAVIIVFFFQVVAMHAWVPNCCSFLCVFF